MQAAASPAHYDNADTLKNKMIFALAEMGDGTAESVIVKLERLETGVADEQNKLFVFTALTSLFVHGHLEVLKKQAKCMQSK